MTEVTSGSEFPDGKQRISIRIGEADAGAEHFRVINTEGLHLDDALILTITLNNDAKYSQPLAVGMWNVGNV